MVECKFCGKSIFAASHYGIDWYKPISGGDVYCEHCGKRNRFKRKTFAETKEVS